MQRELGIAGEEDGSDRWSIDHLFLDQDGVPTLVEVKRSSDTRLRREVVGQLLDYEWTRSAISEALRDLPALANRSFEVYAKGSYPNFTNVVRDSDVDVAAELTALYRNEFIGQSRGAEP